MTTLKSFIKSHAIRTPYRAMGMAHALRFALAARAGLARWTRRRNFFLDPTVKITGWDSVSFGPNCAIGRHTWLNVNHRSSGVPSLDIGANCFIGQSNFFTVGRHIRLGEYVLTASNCSFIGSSHVANDPFSPYLTTGTTNTDVIDIGANCFFGYGAQVIGDVRIGFGSIIGAGAIVRSNVPPLSIVVGSPARIVKRFSIAQSAWVKAENYNDHDSLPSEQEYIQQLRHTHPQLLMPLSAAASRLADV